MREFYPLPETMQRAVIERSGRFRLETVPLPELESGDLLFRLLSAGLGPADLDLTLNIGRTPAALPVTEIAATGESVSGLEPARSRAPARAVARGRWRARLKGWPSSYASPPRPPAAAASSSFPWRCPPTTRPSSPRRRWRRGCCTRRASSNTAGLLVLGLGLAGQALIRMARHQGVRAVVAVDNSATLRERASWSGATHVVRVPEESVRSVVMDATGGAGVQAAVILSGDPSYAPEALQSLAPRGTLILGAPFPASFLFALPGTLVQRRELRIIGVSGFETRDVRDAMQALRLGIVNAETLVSKHVAWSELSAMELEPGYWEHGTHVVVEGPEDPAIEG